MLYKEFEGSGYHWTDKGLTHNLKMMIKFEEREVDIMNKRENTG